MGHALKSSGLLLLKASQVRVYQFVSKLTEKRQQVVHVTLSQRSGEDEVEDERIDATGCIRVFYLYFTVFVILDRMDISVFYMDL
jgi:hypothetical protein